MPRAKARLPEEVVLPEDAELPTEPIEIELPGEVDGPTEVELAPQPEPQPEPEPAPTEPENPLAAQLAAQERAERLQRENAEQQRLIAERDAQLVTERTRGDDAEYNSVLTAIAAEQAVLDKAEQDDAYFTSVADFANAAKARRIVASTAARLDRLEDGKSAFEQRRAAPAPEKPAPQAAPLDFEQRIEKMPESAKSWLRKHPEFINDSALNNKIGNAHNYLINNKGIEPYSTSYFEALDNEFGFKAAAPVVEPQPQQRRSMPVSAPVSRDVPTASGQRQPSSKITLSEEERRVARTSFSSNMTNAQKELLYAQNKKKLNDRRANGSYPMPERN